MLRLTSIIILLCVLLSYLSEHEKYNVTLEVLLGHRTQNLPYPFLQNV